jgi:hypothetical protein
MNNINLIYRLLSNVKNAEINGGVKIIGNTINGIQKVKNFFKTRQYKTNKRILQEKINKYNTGLNPELVMVKDTNGLVKADLVILPKNTDTNTDTNTDKNTDTNTDTNTNDLEFYNNNVRDEKDNVKAFFIIRKLLINLMPPLLNINDPQNIDVIINFKRTFSIIDSNSVWHNTIIDIINKIKEMLPIIKNIYTYTDNAIKEYINNDTNTRLKISLIDDSNISEFNRLKQLFFELLNLLKKHNIHFKDVTETDINDHCKLRLKSDKPCSIPPLINDEIMNLLSDEIKQFIINLEDGGEFDVLNKNLISNYKKYIDSINKDKDENENKIKNFIKQKMKNFLIRNNYNTSYISDRYKFMTNGDIFSNFILDIIQDQKKGGKGIIRNHKLKYLLKKIYKDIKTLSLN